MTEPFEIEIKPAKPRRKKSKVPSAHKLALRAANLRQALAEADFSVHDAAVRRAEAEVARIQADQTARELREAEGTDARNHTYKFIGAVSESSVQKCIYTLTVWARVTPQCPITIIFTSPGGDAIFGMALADHIVGLQLAGHRVTTVGRGMIASMASILFQLGDDRVIGAGCLQLIHEVSIEAAGKPGDIEDAQAWAGKITSRVLKIYAAKSNMTAKQIALKWKRSDWTLDADECVALGFADRIG